MSHLWNRARTVSGSGPGSQILLYHCLLLCLHFFSRKTRFIATLHLLPLFNGGYIRVRIVIARSDDDDRDEHACSRSRPHESRLLLRFGSPKLLRIRIRPGFRSGWRFPRSFSTISFFLNSFHFFVYVVFSFHISFVTSFRNCLFKFGIPYCVEIIWFELSLLDAFKGECRVLCLI